MPVVKHLYVDTFGCFISKHSERLIVTCKGEKHLSAPLLFLESLTVANQGVSISADTVRECTERGIPIFFISASGTPYAALYSAGLTGTIATRRAQLEAYSNHLGLCLALAFSRGKLQNQVNLLKYMGKYRKDTSPLLYKEIMLCALEVADQINSFDERQQELTQSNEVIDIDDIRAELMGNEGRAAQRYWTAIRQIVPERLSFPGRVGRGAKDPLNSALNYGYGVLYGVCERCLVLAGLDPYAGFLHADRPGKPSLTLDFIEEFRQPVVDRTVIGLANKNVAFEQDDHGKLTKEIRRVLVDKITDRLESRAEYNGKHHPLRNVMQMQARSIASYLRREHDEYTPFIMEW